MSFINPAAAAESNQSIWSLLWASTARYAGRHCFVQTCAEWTLICNLEMLSRNVRADTNSIVVVFAVACPEH